MAIDQVTGKHDNVSFVGIVGLCTGDFRVSLRDSRGATIKDDDGQPEHQSFLYRTPAEKEAKRLAKAYNVAVKWL